MAPLADTAAKIGRALDSDVGGAARFTADPDGLTIFTSTPCTSEFRAQAELMLSDPNALHAAGAMDYEKRWPGLTPPTLAECEAFCTSAELL